MRAVVMDRVGGPLSVREVPDPEPAAGGVVVRVHATGLCRSDWHAWAGHEDVMPPHVPGHELAGVISAVGPGVERWSAGDRVTVPFTCGCGRCEWCLSGNAQVCPDQQQPGFDVAGIFFPVNGEVDFHAGFEDIRLGPENKRGVPHPAVPLDRL